MPYKPTPANHIEMHRGVEHRGRRVGAVHDTALKTRILNGLNGLGKALTLQLVVPARRFIGRGEMRKYAVALNAAMEINTTDKVEHLRVMYADTVHTRLDGEMILARRDGTFAIRKSKVRRIDRGHDIELEQRRNRLDRRLAKDEDWFRNPALSELNALVNRRHGKHVGTGRIHNLGALNSSMAISVGFNHAAQALARIQQILIGPRVAAERPAVDLDPGPTRQIGFIHN